MNPPNFRKVLLVWAGVSLLVALSLIGSLYLQKRVAFFVMLNGINLISFALVLVFREQIQHFCASLQDNYKNIALTMPSGELYYRHDTVLGASIIAAALLFAVYSIWLAIGHVDAYKQLIREDGAVEYASAFCWFLAAFFLLLSSVRHAPWKKSRIHRVLPLFLLSLFFIVCGGEEISWGQRIFHFRTPHAIESLNVQQEANLHDIGSISIFSNAFFLLTLIFFLYFPYLTGKNAKLRSLALYFFFPLPHRRAVQVYVIGLAAWLAVGIRFGTLGFHPYSFYDAHYYTQMDDEIFELFAAYSFLAFSLMRSVLSICVETRSIPSDSRQFQLGRHVAHRI